MTLRQSQAGRPPWADQLYEERERREWTQEKLARRMAPAARGLGIVRRLPGLASLIRQVRYWENAEGGPPDGMYQAILARCFGLTPREIFGQWTKLDVPSGLVVATGGSLEIPHFAHAEDNVMHRRKFTGWLLMLGAGGVALPPSIQRMLAGLDQPTILPAITMHDVDKLRTTFQTFLDLEHSVGGAFVRQASMAQAGWALEQLEQNVPGRVEALDAWKIMTARLLCSAGGNCRDDGRHQQGRALMVLGYRVASTVESDLNAESHRAYSLINLARQATDLGRPQTALETLRLAQGIAADATPTTLSMLHAHKARAYGAMGDREGMERELGVVEERYSKVAVDDLLREPWTYDDQPLGQLHYHMGAARYFLVSAGRSTSQADAEATAQSFLAGIPHWSQGYDRIKTISRLRAATALMQAGNPDRAVSIGCEALPALPALRSARVTEAVCDLADATQPYRKDSDVASLLDELRMAA